VAAVIGAVVFDVGECLVDESREYGTWAGRSVSRLSTAGYLSSLLT